MGSYVVRPRHVRAFVLVLFTSILELACSGGGGGGPDAGGGAGASGAAGFSGQGMCGVACSATAPCAGAFAGFSCVSGRCVDDTCTTTAADCASTAQFPEACVVTPESRQCLTPCTSPVDCDQFQPKCISGPTGDRYCTSDEGFCVTDADCGKGLRTAGVCDAPTGRCVCRSPSHCPSPQTCIVVQ